MSNARLEICKLCLDEYGHAQDAPKSALRQILKNLPFVWPKDIAKATTVKPIGHVGYVRSSFGKYTMLDCSLRYLITYILLAKDIFRR